MDTLDYKPQLPDKCEMELINHQWRVEYQEPSPFEILNQYQYGYMMDAIMKGLGIPANLLENNK